jgi:hypothetical protein
MQQLVSKIACGKLHFVLSSIKVLVVGLYLFRFKILDSEITLPGRKLRIVFCDLKNHPENLAPVPKKDFSMEFDSIEKSFYFKV